MSTLRLAGVEVPRVGLGTNRLTTSAEHGDFLREAVAAGVRHIDTAHLYTGGESERVRAFDESTGCGREVARDLPRESARRHGGHEVPPPGAEIVALSHKRISAASTAQNGAASEAPTLWL